MEELKEELKKGKLVTPVGEFNCQSFPINEDCKYFITDEELEKLGKHLLKWKLEEKEVEIEVDDLDNPIYDERTKDLYIIGYQKKKAFKKVFEVSLIDNDPTLENAKIEALAELKKIKQWFNDNDWKVNKVVIGEWELDDQRWLDYLKERKAKRDRQDYLNNLLNNNNTNNTKEEVEEA
jgi:hypothetical protein